MKPIARILVATLAALPPSVLHAQRTPGRAPTRVPLTVVLGPEWPRAGAAYEIQRHVTGNDLDVVLLMENATPEQLSDAVRGVLTARQGGGDTAQQEGRFRIRPHGRSAAVRAPLPWANRVLTDLRAAHPRVVPGVGRVRAVRIWLPPQWAQRAGVAR